jgi:hypothetical protein
MRIETDSLGQASQTRADQTGSSTRSSGGDFAAMLYDGRLSMQALADKQNAVDAIRAKGSAWGSASVTSGGAKGFLASLSAEDLALLQQAKGLAATINVSSLSEEGAANLLLDRESHVDLNNDGLVEVGAAKIITFPPVNAPQSVKDAWEAATAGMSERDRMSLSGHIALPLTFGTTLPGHTGEGPQLGDMANAGFDWNDLIARLLDGIEAGRPYNTAAVSDMLEDGVRRFGDELKSRGLG